MTFKKKLVLHDFEQKFKTFLERQGIRRWLWPQGYCYHRSSASDQGLAKNPAESCPRTREKILWQTRRHPRPGKTHSLPRFFSKK